MKFARFVYLSLLVSSSVFAEDFQIVGEITRPVQVIKNASTLKAQPLKNVTLWKIQLSEKAKNALKKRVTEAQASQTLLNSSASADFGSMQLGMNGVPVLDQGQHGTCATFANTAAVDAALNKGDYVSQFCQLQLGNYLENNGYNPSGWDGSLGKIVLSQMDAFGIVSKEQQQMNGCGSLTEYPVGQSRPQEELSLMEFHKLSESINRKVLWSSLLDVHQAFLDRTNTEKTLREVKIALRRNDRVTFGVLIPDTHLGTVGAVGNYRAENDTWVLSNEILRDLYQTLIQAGHEMVITGYDDNAIARDNNGSPHRGLLTLRNSWGDKAGDHGNFYMSYDYFKALVIEAQQIKAMDDDEDDEE